MININYIISALFMMLLSINNMFAQEMESKKLMKEVLKDCDEIKRSDSFGPPCTIHLDTTPNRAKAIENILIDCVKTKTDKVGGFDLKSDEIDNEVLNSISVEKNPLDVITKDLPSPVEFNSKINVNFSLFNSNSGRNSGNIFDDVSPKTLKPGAYTFVITPDGHMSFGKVLNSWEYGVKHFNLAFGRPIIAAGEIRIDAKNFSYNLSSGTYSREILDKFNTFTRLNGKTDTKLSDEDSHTEKGLGECVGKIFRSQKIKNTSFLPREKLLIDNEPSRDEISEYCKDVNFFRDNKDICSRVIPEYSDFQRKLLSNYISTNLKSWKKKINSSTQGPIEESGPWGLGAKIYVYPSGLVEIRRNGVRNPILGQGTSKAVEKGLFFIDGQLKEMAVGVSSVGMARVSKRIEKLQVDLIYAKRGLLTYNLGRVLNKIRTSEIRIQELEKELKNELDKLHRSRNKEILDEGIMCQKVQKKKIRFFRQNYPGVYNCYLIFDENKNPKVVGDLYEQDLEGYWKTVQAKDQKSASESKLVMEQRVAVLEKVAGQVERLHDWGILHNDLKPKNIFVKLDEKGNFEDLTVGDLGSAIKVKNLDFKEPLFVGTPSFMAPEVYSGEWPGRGQKGKMKTALLRDVFSFGIMMRKMVEPTYQSPYDLCFDEAKREKKDSSVQSGFMRKCNARESKVQFDVLKGLEEKATPPKDKAYYRILVGALNSDARERKNMKEIHKMLEQLLLVTR